MIKVPLASGKFDDGLPPSQVCLSSQCLLCCFHYPSVHSVSAAAVKRIWQEYVRSQSDAITTVLELNQNSHSQEDGPLFIYLLSIRVSFNLFCKISVVPVLLISFLYEEAGDHTLNGSFRLSYMLYHELLVSF